MAEQSDQGHEGEADARKSVSLHPDKTTQRSVNDHAARSAESHNGVHQRRVMRHKSSAVALMNRGEMPKADAETGTTSTNAFGTVEAPPTREELPPAQKISVKEKGDPTAFARFRAMHTYEGSDPSVLKLLDTLFQEQYPNDLVEFGPLVIPIPRRQRIKRNTGDSTDTPWRPEGSLVALFGEHTSAVNRIVLAPDHAFFSSCSDDGTVKFWDAARLERNIAYRSRQTHKHVAGAKVKSLCFVENTHCLVSGATDGSIHVTRVDYAQGSGTSRYGKMRVLKTYQLPVDEYAVWLEHFKLDNHSVLLILTNTSRVVAVDLRTMKVLYVLTNPVQHGAPTCFCVDKRRAWLLVGTTHGILSLWDLRFRVLVKAWGLPGGTPIQRLSVHPFKGRGRWVCVAGGCSHGEVTVWDVEKSQCREVYRTGVPKEKTTKIGAMETQYEAWKVDNENCDGILGRFATTLEPNPSGGVGAGNGGMDRGIRTFVPGIDSLEDGRDSRYGFLLTAGSDRKIRFWDLTRIESSMVVSGMELDDPRPSYTSLQPTTLLVVHTERVPLSPQQQQEQQAARGTNVPSKSSPVRKTSSNGGGSGNVGGHGHSSGAARPPRSTVISLQQQQLLTAHLDSITDIALLESPYGMVISGDRSGMIYVFR